MFVIGESWGFGIHKVVLFAPLFRCNTVFGLLRYILLKHRYFHFLIDGGNFRFIKASENSMVFYGVFLGTVFQIIWKFESQVGRKYFIEYKIIPKLPTLIYLYACNSCSGRSKSIRKQLFKQVTCQKQNIRYIFGQKHVFTLPRSDFICF